MITNSFINQSRKDGFTRFVICFNVQAGADQLLQEWRVYKRRQGTHHQVILCILIIFLLLHQHMLQSHSMISIGKILMTIDSNSTIASHAAITFVVIILTIATTVGYQVINDDDDHGNISITIQFAQRPPPSSRWALLIILTIIILIRTPARTLRANWVLSCMTRWTRTPTSPGKAWCGDEEEDKPKPKPYSLWLRMMISLVYENDGARVGCKAIEMLLVTMT